MVDGLWTYDSSFLFFFQMVVLLPCACILRQSISLWDDRDIWSHFATFRIPDNETTSSGQIPCWKGSHASWKKNPGADTFSQVSELLITLVWISLNQVLDWSIIFVFKQNLWKVKQFEKTLSLTSGLKKPISLGLKTKMSFWLHIQLLLFTELYNGYWHGKSTN